MQDLGEDQRVGGVHWFHGDGFYNTSCPRGLLPVYMVGFPIFPLMYIFFLFFSRDLKHNLISTILPGAFQGLSELRKL